MIRTVSAAALAATLLALAAPSAAVDPAADPAADAMPLPLAREVVNKTIELVESKGVYPRSQADYAQARKALLALVDDDVAQADRKAVHAGIRKLLASYANGPLAVVVGSRTSSAGEMLLVALLGEARVQTFGQTSHGLSTANATYPLADGSTLVLTTKRYALGDGPVYRGGIPAMHPSEKGEPADAAVRTAVEWAAAQSPACAAAPGTAAPDRT